MARHATRNNIVVRALFLLDCRPLKRKKEAKKRLCHLDMAEMFASTSGDNALSHEGAKWRPVRPKDVVRRRGGSNLKEVRGLYSYIGTSSLAAAERCIIFAGFVLLFLAHREHANFQAGTNIRKVARKNSNLVVSSFLASTRRKFAAKMGMIASFQSLLRMPILPWLPAKMIWGRRQRQSARCGTVALSGACWEFWLPEGLYCIRRAACRCLTLTQIPAARSAPSDLLLSGGKRSVIGSCIYVPKVRSSPAPLSTPFLPSPEYPSSFPSKAKYHTWGLSILRCSFHYALVWKLQDQGKEWNERIGVFVPPSQVWQVSFSSSFPPPTPGQEHPTKERRGSGILALGNRGVSSLGLTFSSCPSKRLQFIISIFYSIRPLGFGSICDHLQCGYLVAPLGRYSTRWLRLWMQPPVPAYRVCQSGAIRNISMIILCNSAGYAGTPRAIASHRPSHLPPNRCRNPNVDWPNSLQCGVIDASDTNLPPLRRQHRLPDTSKCIAAAHRTAQRDQHPPSALRHRTSPLGLSHNPIPSRRLALALPAILAFSLTQCCNGPSAMSVPIWVGRRFASLVEYKKFRLFASRFSYTLDSCVRRRLEYSRKASWLAPWRGKAARGQAASGKPSGTFSSTSHTIGTFAIRILVASRWPGPLKQAIPTTHTVRPTTALGHIAYLTTLPRLVARALGRSTGGGCRPLSLTQSRAKKEKATTLTHQKPAAVSALVWNHQTNTCYWHLQAQLRARDRERTGRECAISSRDPMLPHFLCLCLAILVGSAPSHLIWKKSLPASPVCSLVPPAMAWWCLLSKVTYAVRIEDLSKAKGEWKKLP
ncbi:hypothetical protein CCUS01_01398 [Colletotrichum cuscutae]|uniref:Uncharacterized protein n=1 Tax=Colletotrichum cuscutae TaxID=1209917 RepID=A0AAI9UNK6_9PEZI|nr:hypothetical protein CCUS01_01398 [Colletotrichum cuscutae]